MAIDELAPGSSHERQAAARAEREAEAVAALDLLERFARRRDSNAELARLGIETRESRGV